MNKSKEKYLIFLMALVLISNAYAKTMIFNQSGDIKFNKSGFEFPCQDELSNPRNNITITIGYESNVIRYGCIFIGISERGLNQWDCRHSNSAQKFEICGDNCIRTRGFKFYNGTQ